MAGKVHTRFILALLVAMVLIPSIGVGQELRDSATHSRKVRTSIPVDFRQSDTVIDPNYAGNTVALHNLDSIINEIKVHDDYHIVALELFGTVSPEGSAKVNRRISKGRVRALENYITKRIEVADSVIKRKEYIDWAEFRKVMLDNNSSYRDEVVKIIDTDYPRTKDWDGSIIDGRIIALRKLQGGWIWQQLIANEFKQLRSAGATIVSQVPIPVEEDVVVITEEVKPESTIVIAAPEPIVTPEVKEEPKDDRFVPMVSIKFNAAAVPLMLLNAGFEVRLAKQWSLDMMGVYSPYNYFRSDRKVRLLAMHTEARYWWGETMHKGHFLGLHVPMGGFNLQMSDGYRYQDPNHMAWGVGVSYGYAMPMSKKRNWIVEFTLGVGYMNIKYDIYEGVHNGKYLRTETMNYFGPTRLGINIAYRFDIPRKSQKTKRLN